MNEATNQLSEKMIHEKYAFLHDKSDARGMAQAFRQEIRDFLQAKDPEAYANINIRPDSREERISQATTSIQLGNQLRDNGTLGKDIDSTEQLLIAQTIVREEIDTSDKGKVNKIIQDVNDVRAEITIALRTDTVQKLAGKLNIEVDPKHISSDAHLVEGQVYAEKYILEQNPELNAADVESAMLQVIEEGRTDKTANAEKRVVIGSEGFTVPEITPEKAQTQAETQATKLAAEKADLQAEKNIAASIQDTLDLKDSGTILRSTEADPNQAGITIKVGENFEQATTIIDDYLMPLREEAGFNKEELGFSEGKGGIDYIPLGYVKITGNQAVLEDFAAKLANGEINSDAIKFAISNLSTQEQTTAKPEKEETSQATDIDAIKELLVEKEVSLPPNPTDAEVVRIAKTRIPEELAALQQEASKTQPAISNATATADEINATNQAAQKHAKLEKTEAEEAQQTANPSAIKVDKLKAAINDGSSFGRGSQGADEIKELQTFLAGHGYPLGEHGIDGRIGPDTQQALMTFQKDQGIAKDGVAGPDTLASILQTKLMAALDLNGDAKLDVAEIKAAGHEISADGKNVDIDGIQIAVNTVNATLDRSAEAGRG